MRARPSRMQSAVGRAPPQSEVPAPRGTTGALNSAATRSTAATSSALRGRVTMSGGWR